MLSAKADSIPLFTTRSNSSSVIPGGASRMLTLAGPMAVATWKSGRISNVAGDPAQAETALNANNDMMNEVRIGSFRGIAGSWRLRLPGEGSQKSAYHV